LLFQHQIRRKIRVTDRDHSIQRVGFTAAHSDMQPADKLCATPLSFGIASPVICPMPPMFFMTVRIDLAVLDQFFSPTICAPSEIVMTA